MRVGYLQMSGRLVLFIIINNNNIVFAPVPAVDLQSIAVLAGGAICV